MAAVVVVFVHAAATLQAGVLPRFGWLAVDFFFCLSGFVVAQAYEPGLATGRLTFGDFIRKRVIRLHPMILLGCAFGSLLMLSSALHSTSEPVWRVPVLAVSAAVLIPAGEAFWGDPFPVNSPYWSLLFEAVANIAWGVGFRIRTAALVTITVIAGIALASIIHAYGSAAGLGWAGAHWLRTGLARVTFSFGAGVVIYRLRLVERAPALPGLLLAAVLLALLLVGFRPIPGWANECAVILVGFPALVILGPRATAPRWSVPAWLFLGDLSYPLYALHAPTLKFVAKLNSHALHLPPAAAAVLGISLSVAVAWAALAWVDVPVRRWLSGRRRASQISAPVPA